MFEKIRKRDGRIVDFDSSKITGAIARAGKATGEFGQNEAEKLTLKVLSLAHESALGLIPSVEEIQDIVERVFLSSPFHRSAKAYILYRDQRTQIRNISARKNIELVENCIQRMGSSRRREPPFQQK